MKPAIVPLAPEAEHRGFIPVARADVGYELRMTERAAAVINKLPTNDVLRRVAAGAWFTEREAAVVAADLNRRLFPPADV